MDHSASGDEAASVDENGSTEHGVRRASAIVAFLLDALASGVTALPPMHPSAHLRRGPASNGHDRNGNGGSWPTGEK
jgi:hypothetical protein